MKKILLLLLFPAVVCGQKIPASFDKYMQAEVLHYNFNGNVLLAKHGHIIYERSFGYADMRTKNKLGSNSVFDCGSIAKEFTAMGILMLKDKGLLAYTDTLRQFFPELPYTNVTIQQLLTHTSGMPNGFRVVANNFDHNKVASNTDLVRLMAGAKAPLLFEPGTNLMYSGTAFNLLAAIIEKLSGQLYKDYMLQHIFKPLGMAHTQVANGPRRVESIASMTTGYSYNDSLHTYEQADTTADAWPTYLAGITGEGMIITTTGDLLKWDRALKNNTLLKAATQQQMLSPQATRTTVPVVTFGYGMRVGSNERGKYIFHNGTYPGFQAMHIRYVDDDITAIVLSNNESHAEFIADALVNIAMGKSIVQPHHYKVQPQPAVDIKKLTGKFLMPLALSPYQALFPAALIIKNDRLWFHNDREPDVELLPASATEFFFANGTDQQITFELDANGNVAKVYKISWGLKEEVKRVD